MCHNRAIPHEAEFYLNGNLGELDHLAEEIRRFSSAHALDEQAAFDLNLALEELFANSVQHGGCKGLDDAARVRLRVVDGGQVEAEYSDRGHAFDPTQAPEPDIHAPLEARDAGGLGIHLVRKIMQDLRYSRTDEWNRIVMRRRRL